MCQLLMLQKSCGCISIRFYVYIYICINTHITYISNIYIYTYIFYIYQLVVNWCISFINNCMAFEILLPTEKMGTPMSCWHDSKLTHLAVKQTSGMVAKEKKHIDVGMVIFNYNVYLYIIIHICSTCEW